MLNTYSENMLKTFEECPQKYFFQYVENIQIPQNMKHSETGKNLHALINYYFKGFDITKILKSLNQEEEILWQNFLNLKIKKENIYKSEYSFNVKIDETSWLTGRIDAIINTNDKYLIYDWKTGNIPKDPESDLQTCIYLFSIYEILKTKKLLKKIDDLSFIYTNLKTNQIFQIYLNDKKLVEIKNRILSTIDRLQSYIDFTHNSQENQNLKLHEKSNKNHKNIACKKCKYKIICETDVFF